MPSEAEVEERFKSLGAVFLTPATLIAERLRGIRALVFDWDGVFNGGAKGEAVPSTFSEPDSMGTNMLRYALWRVHGLMPLCAVISGAHNPTARQFAAREHFHEIYSGFRNKKQALDRFRATHALEHEQIAFVFDDVNDLGAASNCGVRVLVRRDASPLLQDFAAMNSLCDYITANEADRYAVREISEMLMGLLGGYDATIASRIASDDAYDKYFRQRQSIKTASFDSEPE